MKKIKLILSLVVGFILPAMARAVNYEYPNPANGFLVDLTKLGQPNTFGGLLMFFVNIALGIVGILSIAFIVYGGFLYITSRGDEEQAGSGKKTLTNAIIGLVIVILSYTIVIVIFNALQGKV